MNNGDLISREALIDDIDAAMENSGMGYVIGQTLKRYVKRQPAVDAVEVVHAKWIEDGYFEEHCVCSYCGTPAIEGIRTRYCPLCGARMDGE